MKKYLFTITISITIIIGGFWLIKANLAGQEIENQSFTPLVLGLETQKPPPEITFVAGGDVMLSRHVGEKIRKYKDNSWLFRKIYEEFNSADLAFVNLESPFYNQGLPVTEGMVFKAEPDTIDGLKLAGIDIVSFANNHARNQGNNGLLYTFKHLKSNGIEYVGAGRNSDEAYQGKIIEVKGIKFGFLAYSYDTQYEQSENPTVAGMDLEKLKQGISDLKNKADFIIISMHAGNEYTTKPNKQQTEFAHAAIDNGANLVIGHHSHWIQKIENYQGKYIFYGLGNLVFDQMWSDETQKGLVVKLTLSGKNLKHHEPYKVHGSPKPFSGLGQIELKPVKIDDYGQPRWMSEEESREILDTIGIANNIIEIEE